MMAGPLAVLPELQGQGVGAALLRHAECLHQETVVDVVSCRTDLQTFYAKRGYRWDTYLMFSNLAFRYQK